MIAVANLIDVAPSRHRPVYAAWAWLIGHALSLPNGDDIASVSAPRPDDLLRRVGDPRVAKSGAQLNVPQAIAGAALAAGALEAIGEWGEVMAGGQR